MGFVRWQNNMDGPKSNGNKPKISCRHMTSICVKLIIVTVILQRLFATPVFDVQETTEAISSTNHSSLVDIRNQTIGSSFTNSSSAQATRTISTATAPIDHKPMTKAANCVHKIVTKARSKSNLQNHFENSRETHRRQILYLHPGPPKTATTTIQQLLTDHQTQLNNDNIFLLGKTMPSEHWNCKLPHPSHCIMFEQYAEKSETNCTTLIAQQLDEYFRMGANVVISDEVLGAMFATPKNKKHHERARGALNIFFNNILRRNDWEIRLLIGYRPYFDFVRSQFSQLHTIRTIPSKKGPPKKFKGKLSLIKWPGKQGGKHIPPLKDRLFQKEWPTSDELVDLFKPHVDSVRVFDITQNNKRGNLSLRLFCDFMDNANRSCSFRKEFLDASKNNHTEVRKNVAISLDYDRIATAAAAKGMVSTFKSRRYDVASEIQKFVELSKTIANSTIGNLPLVCPTKDQSDKLYNLSMAQEIKLFPERNPDWETKLLFDDMMEQKKLCSVDTKQVLEVEEWKEFFRSLD